jgi:hypothetical protein
VPNSLHVFSVARTARVDEATPLAIELVESGLGFGGRDLSNVAVAETDLRTVRLQLEEPHAQKNVHRADRISTVPWGVLPGPKRPPDPRSDSHPDLVLILDRARSRKSNTCNKSVPVIQLFIRHCARLGNRAAAKVFAVRRALVLAERDAADAAAAANRSLSVWQVPTHVSLQS